jgi:Flp pilus assembly protein TadG
MKALVAQLRNRKQQNQRKGAMVLFIAGALILLLIAAAFSLDVAYMHMVRAELRTATDSAARAGAETLARTQDRNAAVQAALAAAAANEVAGQGLTLDPADVLLGTVTQNNNGGFDFVEGGAQLTSVKVDGERIAGSADGPVSLFFAPVLGVTNFQPIKTASATASVRDIALVLDRSGSMRTTENGVSRIDALKQAVSAFIAEIEASSPNARISLTTYSTTASIDSPLTDDFAQITSDVNGLPAQGFTNIFQALQFGSDTLQGPERRAFADRTIVLMTDGNFNVGGD